MIFVHQNRLSNDLQNYAYLKGTYNLISLTFSFSLNYIKQNRLKDTLHWTPLFSEETLNTHKYDIPVVRGGHLEGPHVFGILICAFVSEL